MNAEALKDLGPVAVDMLKKALPEASRYLKNYLETGSWPESAVLTPEEILAHAENLEKRLGDKVANKDSAKLLMRTAFARALDLALPLALAAL